MGPSLLGRLPPELLVLVMTFFDTPQDLWSFAKCTSFIYQSFINNKLTILSAVIQNMIPGENLYIAIATCGAAVVSRSWPSSHDIRTVTDAQTEFLKSNPGGFAPLTSSLRDERLLKSLFKLGTLSCRFLESFAQASLGCANEKLSILQNLQQCTTSVTFTEKIAIQRAFFRFEMYRRLHPAHITGHPDYPYDDPTWEALSDQTCTFLQMFSPWEREQILCVHEFLLRMAADVVEDAMHKMLAKINGVIRDEAIKATTGSQGVSVIEILKSLLESWGVDIISFGSSPWNRIEYMAAQGFPFLIWLARLPIQHKTAVLYHLLERIDDLSLSDVLYRWDYHNGRNDDYASRCQGMGTVPSNSVWDWIMKWRSASEFKDVAMRYEFREMGYLFWDVARVRDVWKLLDHTPSTLHLSPLRIESRIWPDLNLDLHYFKGLSEIYILPDAQDRAEKGISKALNSEWLKEFRNPFGEAEFLRSVEFQ